MMNSKEKARKEVKFLVEKFNRLKEQGLLSRYKESGVKKDFIEPLFEALGWDIRNKKVFDEVITEETILKGEVDYAFRINHINKFFVEAKKFSENIDNKKFIKQAVNYGWQSSVKWTVLTNFEKIKFLQTDVKEKNIYENQWFELGVNEFLERFEKLWYLSKESFVKGIIDKEAEFWGRTKKKVPIDEQLFLDLNNWRSKLSKGISNHNKDLSSSQIDDIVQKILDRLIFIRKTEDIGIEGKHLQSAINKWKNDVSKGLYHFIIKIFKFYRKHYDSDLFEPHLCDKIFVPNNILFQVINGLYNTEDGTRTYDFSVITADVLGNIYEQYLGHILKKTKKITKIKNGKAYRKERGIYYTPTYIVDYIVRNTLGELLKGKKIDEIKKVRILDPACGSGSFLIKAFDIFELHYLEKTKKVGQLDFLRKSNILTNNIFGVDVDPKAVEIARLNLMLKTTEKKRKLPVLKENIKCGDSLIDDPNMAGSKAFKWGEEFKEILREGGFDVVFGNPPYINAIQLTKTFGKEIKNYWKNKYYSAKGTYDIFVLFFEQALNICKNGGFVSFITPNKYLSSPYGRALRDLILNNYKLVKVLDLSKVKVFDDPSVYPIITIIQKIKPKEDYTIITEKIFSENMDNKKTYKISSKNLKLLPNYIWGIILSDNVKIIERIFQRSKPLEEVAIVQATSTAAESDEYSKYIKEKGRGFPIINTGTIDRYSTTYGITRFMNKGQQFKKPFLNISRISKKRRKLYKTPKIILAKLALRIEGFLDNNGSYASINTNCIHTPKEDIPIEYIAGIINSKLMSFIYSEVFSGLRMSGGYFQFQAPQLRILPIVKASENQQKKLSMLVKRIVSLHKKLNKISDRKKDERAKIEGEIEKTDKKIDELVYKIYGITKKEKEKIEKSLDN